MRRLLLAALLVALSVPAPGAGAAPPGPLSDLPENGPPALYRDEPVLPRAAGWTASEDFPRVSGTGRLAGGALLWSDYLYDDHGAITVPGQDPAQTAGSPSFGGYGYGPGPAHGNGADVFRAAIARDDDATTWRVDWTTLADATVPLAVWTLDRDDDAATGVSAWPAAAGVSSPGIDSALVVSSRGARLLDLLSGAELATLPVTTDLAARSFVVRVPTAVLPVSGTWRVRLASGLADAAGTGLAPATGALPGQTRVYNVTFRTHEQEPPINSFWDDLAQTQALTTGDVSAFSVGVDWAALAARRSTPEGRPTGWTTRWYVSAVDLGPGVLTGPETIMDRAPNYLGRVQPYSVYVPADLPTPAPLTFLLHSLTQNHNQYAATTPKLTQQACEDRRSLCVTALGRGGDGYYLGEAQLDFWQVWHEVAEAFDLDVDSTITAGYSMGGIGSNQIAMAHPDLFAQDVTLAGAVGAVAELENLRHVPVYQAGGALDELVPVTTQKAQADALAALGYRYRWLVHPAEDHVGYELRDGFSDAAAFMGQARRTTRPARVTYSWSPVDLPSRGGGTPPQVAQTQRPDLGVGTTGAYWLRSLSARSGVTAARVDAVSSALPDPVVTAVPGNDVLVPGDPSPAVVQEQTWDLGASPGRSPAVSLELTGVRSATLLLADAGLPATGCSTVTVTSDGPATLVLAGSRAQTAVPVAAGERVLSVRTAGAAAPRLVGACTAGTVGLTSDGGVADGRVPALASTGAGAALPLAGLVLLSAAAYRVRTRRSA